MKTSDYVRRILDEFGVEFESKQRISQFAGLAPFFEFLKKGNIRNRLVAMFGEQKGRTVFQIVIGIIAGAKNMEEVEKISRDPYVRQKLKGICGPVNAIQLGRDVKNFSKHEIERLHDFVMSLPILEIARDVPRSERLIFDVDATSIEKYGEQQGVEHGYIEENKIEPCYQYLFVRCHQFNSILYGTIRSGSSHSQNGFVTHLQRILPTFKSQWKTLWRADSGYFNEEAFDVFSENEATFLIKAPMSESRISLAAHAPDLIWFSDPNDPEVAYASCTTNTAQGTLWREVFKRSKSRDTQQLSFLELVGFRYDCVATNDLITNEVEIFKLYNGRANIENSIRELKNDFALGKIVTDSFDANDVLTQITLMAFFLMGHFKRKVLDKTMSKMQLNTLRWRLFSIPGRALWASRQCWLRIQNAFTSAEQYADIFYRIKYLRSWVLAPPQIQTA